MGYLSPNFLIGSLKIGSIEGASCFNMGNNWPTNFASHKKQNQGFGSITGDHNDIKDILSRLDDADGLDMYNQTGIEEVPGWIKEMITSNVFEEPEEDGELPKENPIQETE